MTKRTIKIDDGAYAVTHCAGSLDVYLSRSGSEASLPIALSSIEDVRELLVEVKLSVDTAERRKARCEE